MGVIGDTKTLKSDSEQDFVEKQLIKINQKNFFYIRSQNALKSITNLSALALISQLLQYSDEMQSILDEAWPLKLKVP